MVDEFSGGGSTEFSDVAIFAVAAVPVLSCGVWLIRRSGVPISDALNW